MLEYSWIQQIKATKYSTNAVLSIGTFIKTKIECLLPLAEGKEVANSKYAKLSLTKRSLIFLNRCTYKQD